MSAPELQPYSTFSVLNVSPERVTDLKLSGGKTIPYIYQLGVNSTVPYVKLIGSSIGQKLFSWTEKIVVPPNEMVTVANASLHPGDIAINSGWDPAVIPARVTVPVAIVEPTPGLFTTQFDVDTRRARRAFLAGLTGSGIPGMTVQVIGRARNRSHPVSVANSYLAAPIAQYTTTIVYPPATSIGLLPLGQNAVVSDPDHALLDLCNIQWTVDNPTDSGALYYVLEYA